MAKTKLMGSTYLTLRNCFIPKDGALRHCHVFVKDYRTEKIELVSDAEYGTLPFNERTFGEYSVRCDEEDKITVFECAGIILSPGFIDIQLNGAFGVDFSNPLISGKDVQKVAENLTAFGVTHFCPTLVSSSRETYEKLIPLIGNMCRDDRSFKPTWKAALLGMHLEGPFFDESKRGAHESEHIREKMDSKSFSNTYNKDASCLYDGAGVSIVTLAPELPGALDQIQALSENNITVSLGHTNAVLKDGIDAKKRGATLLTHLFNAMRPFHHREPGLLGLLQHCENGDDEEGIYYSIIADGLHSHPASVKMAYTMSKNVVLVTDAMSAMGLGDGQHSLGSKAVTVLNDMATISGTDTLAGSVASMDSCVRTFKTFTGCSHYEALQAATRNPAKVLGLANKMGSIEEGLFADFVLLDDSLNVIRTILAGSIVHSGDDECHAFKDHCKKLHLEGSTIALSGKRKEIN